MKREFAFVVTCLATLLTMSTQARVLNPEEALSRAMISEKMPAKARALNVKTASPSLIIKDKSQTPALYVFSQGERMDDGFMVVAADDAVLNPVLGYSDTGSLEDGNIAPACRAWLDEYARQIKWLRDNNIGTSITPEGFTQVRELQRAARKKYVYALCSTKWNQSEPFYNMTPTYNGQHTVTGCTATAMAQLLKYYEWPLKGTGSHSYTWTTYGNQTVSFDFDSNPFDWDNMLDVYKGGESTVQTDAVALLMKACGVMAEMSYSVSSSGANMERGLANILKYLGYAPTAQAVERSYYTIEEWENLIYNNLFTYGPVIMSGFNEDSGHCFICDGYVKAGYFHFNWGWGGQSDGLFELTALDPGQQGIGGSASGYDYNIAAVLGVQVPKDGETYQPVYHMRGDIGLTLTVNTSTRYMTVSGGMWNKSLYAIPILSMGVKLTNAKTGESTYAESWSKSDTLNRYYGYNSYSVQIPRMDDGVYLVKPAFKAGSNYLNMDWIDAEIPAYDHQYVTVTYKNGVITSAAPQYMDVIEIENGTQKSRACVGLPFYMTVDLTNPNDNEYYGSVTLAVLNSDADGFIGRGEYITMLLPGHSTVEWDYISPLYRLSGATISTGENYVTPVDMDERLLSPYACSLEVTAAPTTTGKLQKVTDFALTSSYRGIKPRAGASSNEPVVGTYDLTFTGTLKNSGGYHYSAPRIYFFQEGGGSSSDRVIYNNVFLEDGESHDMKFNCKYDNAVEGKRYFAILYDHDPGTNQLTSISDRLFFTAGNTTAVNELEVDSDSEIISTVYYNLNGIEIPGRPEQPGVYIRRDVKSDGTVNTVRETIR